MNLPKTFLSISFGCRVNIAETNQWSQALINLGYIPFNTETNPPSIILINTCAITKKGEKESLNKIKSLSRKYPDSQLYITGCANFDKVKNLANINIYSNHQKEAILNRLQSAYTSKIKDKFSQTHRYLLKVQSGCNQFCSYCLVPFRRDYLWSLPINQAITITQQAVKEGYKEIIITGVNLDQYEYGFSDLVEALLKETNINLISFGSIPLNCIDEKFTSLLSEFNSRLPGFLHIPIQSGSDKILSLMNRTYTKSDILEKFNKLKHATPNLVKLKSKKSFHFGTDIIVGFPTETDSDFQETLDLCRQINFTKIHTFPFSPRPGTKARILFEKSNKLTQETIKSRSQKLRDLIKN